MAVAQPPTWSRMIWPILLISARTASRRSTSSAREARTAYAALAAGPSTTPTSARTVLIVPVLLTSRTPRSGSACASGSRSKADATMDRSVLVPIQRSTVRDTSRSTTSWRCRRRMRSASRGGFQGMKRSSDGAEADAGQPDDPPDGVGVDDEVLARLLGGLQAEAGGEIMARAAPRSSGESVIPGASRRAAGARSGLAAPGLEAGLGVEPVGDRDLLLPGGQVGARGEVGTAVREPRALRELQPAVVAVAGVDVPVAAGLALGDPVPHRGVREVEAGAGGVAGRRRRRRGRRSGSGSGGLGADGDLGTDGHDLVHRVLGDLRAGLVARLELAVDPHLVEGGALLAGDALGGRLLGALGQGGVVLAGNAERDRLGLADRLLLDAVDRDGQPLSERGLGCRVDAVLRTEGDLELLEGVGDGRAGAGDGLAGAVDGDRDVLGGGDGERKAGPAERLGPRDGQLRGVGADAELGEGAVDGRGGRPVVGGLAVLGDGELAAVTHDDRVAVA